MEVVVGWPHGVPPPGEGGGWEQQVNSWVTAQVVSNTYGTE